MATSHAHIMQVKGRVLLLICPELAKISNLSRIWESKTSKHYIFWLACLSIIANQFCFETGCLDCNLNVMQAESFKL